MYACLCVLEGMKEKSHWVSRSASESKEYVFKRKNGRGVKKAKLRQRVRTDCKKGKMRMTGWVRHLRKKKRCHEVYTCCINRHQRGILVTICSQATRHIHFPSLFFPRQSHGKAMRMIEKKKHADRKKVRQSKRQRNRETRGQRDLFSFVGCCKRL